MVTGNYNFFNFLTALLAVSVYADKGEYHVLNCQMHEDRSSAVAAVPAESLNFHTLSTLIIQRSSSSRPADLGFFFRRFRATYTHDGDRALPELSRSIDPTLVTAVVVGCGAILARFFGASVDESWTPTFAITFSPKEFDRFNTVAMTAGILFGALGLILAIFTDMYNSRYFACRSKQQDENLKRFACFTARYKLTKLCLARASLCVPGLAAWGVFCHQLQMQL